jgi:hypothetical protein
MINFKLVSPEGAFINHSASAPKARINGAFVSTYSDLARFIWSQFKRWSGVATFNEWAQSMAESHNENAEAGKTYTAENIDIMEAFDNCANNFTLNIDGKHVHIYHFLSENLPEDKRK